MSATRAGLGHQDALGDLEPEGRRGQAVAGQAVGDGLGQRRCVQVAGRDVDRDRDLQPDRPPLGGLGERGVDDVAR